MKRSHGRWVKLGVLILLPLALFFVTWQAASWRPKPLFQADVGIFAISPDEPFLACVTGDTETLTVFDLRNGREIQHYNLDHSICVLSFSPDGQSLAVGWNEDLPPKSSEEINPMRIIGVSLLSLKGDYRAFQATNEVIFDYPTQLRFAPDGRTLWMASTDNLRAWDIASGKLKCQWRRKEEWPSSLPFFAALSQDCTLYFCSDSDCYSVWDVKSKKRLLRIRLSNIANPDLIFSANAMLVSYTTTNGFFPVIETRTGRRLWQTTGDSDMVFTPGKAFNRKGNYFIVRDARTGKFLYRLPANPGTYPLKAETRHWLYTTNEGSVIFRQRLDEPPFYLRRLLR